MANVTVLGIPELKAKFAEISVKMQTAVIENALNAGAKVVHDNAVRMAPRRTGDLQGSIKIHPEKGERTIYPQEPHGLWAEEGTDERHHKGTGKSVGSMPKSPFLKPALHDPAVETAIKNSIRMNIEAMT